MRKDLALDLQLLAQNYAALIIFVAVFSKEGAEDVFKVLVLSHFAKSAIYCNYFRFSNNFGTMIANVWWNRCSLRIIEAFPCSNVYIVCCTLPFHSLIFLWRICVMQDFWSAVVKRQLFHILCHQFVMYDVVIRFNRNEWWVL